MSSSRKNAYLLVAFVSCTTVTMLTAQTPSSALNTSQQSVKPVSSTTSEPRLEERYPRYKIQNQDTLLLSFPLSPELNQTVTVQPDGYVNLQTAGSLHIQGLTVPEVVEAVKKAYAGILNSPIVNVDLEDYQKPLFTVSGQVGKPGQYDLRTETTVAEAIAVAGGLSPSAKTQVLLFHRTSADWFEVKKLNLKDVLNGKNPNEDPIVKPGDMIFVPEKFITNFRKYVPYSLNAGTYIPVP
jgi:protein involved in polysaccharide export with SLBB domain